MEEMRLLTGWNFAGAMKGDTCIIAAFLTNEQGKKVEVAMEIKRADVLIRVTALDDSFDKEFVDRVTKRLDILVEVEIKEGESLTVTHHEPLGVLEHSVKGVVKQCIVPMVDVVGEVVAGNERA